MYTPKQLYHWDFPDTITVPDGYDTKTEPDLSRENFQLLVEHYNNLVEYVNALREKPNVEELADLVDEENTRF